MLTRHSTLYKQYIITWIITPKITTNTCPSYNCSWWGSSRAIIPFLLLSTANLFPAYSVRCFLVTSYISWAQVFLRTALATHNFSSSQQHANMYSMWTIISIRMNWRQIVKCEKMYFSVKCTSMINDVFFTQVLWRSAGKIMYCNVQRSPRSKIGGNEFKKKRITVFRLLQTL